MQQMFAAGIPQRMKKRAKITDDQMSAIARALADPRRFAIFQQIAAHNEMPCTALDVRGDIGAATISHHLRELQEAGLIAMRREGRLAYLTLVRPAWEAYVDRLASI
jgi:ArsR family transcriptional regulator